MNTETIINAAEAAERLGMDRSNFCKMLRRHDPRFPSARKYRSSWLLDLADVEAFEYQHPAYKDQ